MDSYGHCVTQAQYNQEVAHCDANVLQWTNGLRSDFAAWLDSQFTPLTSANATALKTALAYGTRGSQGAIIEDLSGAAGAAFGGLVGYVVGFSAAAILDPILDPLIKASAEAIWNTVLYGITRQGYADCAGTNAPASQIGQLKVSLRPDQVSV